MGNGNSGPDVSADEIPASDIASASREEVQNAIQASQNAMAMGNENQAQAAHAIEQAEEVSYLKARERLEGWTPADKFMSGPPWKFVWFSSAEDFPNSELLDPVWKEASQIWTHFKGSSPDIRVHVDWQHKDCYGPGWTRGADYDDCPITPAKMKNRADHLGGLRSFPTLRLYGPMGQTDFHGQRTTQNLLNFVRNYVDPPEDHETRNPKDFIDDPPGTPDVETPEKELPLPVVEPEPTETSLDRVGSSGMGFAPATLGAVAVNASREELELRRRSCSSRSLQSSRLPRLRTPQLPRHLPSTPGSQGPGRPEGYQALRLGRDSACQRQQPGLAQGCSKQARQASLWSFL